MFHPNAKMFALEVMGYIGTMFGTQHCDGIRYCANFLELSASRFGMLAPTVLETWEINSSEDLGQMIFEMTEEKMIGKSPQDKIEDFNEIFKTQEYFASKTRKEWFK